MAGLAEVEIVVSLIQFNFIDPLPLEAQNIVRDVDAHTLFSIENC